MSLRVLSGNKARCRRIIRQRDGGPYDSIFTNILIFRVDNNAEKEEDSYQLLLLKVSADNMYEQNMWVIPGCVIEDTDPTIEGAVKQQLHEHTGMEMETVVASTEPFFVTKVVTAANGEGGPVISVELRLAYICTVKEYLLKLDEEEFSTGAYFDRKTVKDLDMPEVVRMTVDRAFRWWATS
ncbi:MAG: hypothetical protein Q9207_003195 [Kuettlingeria erythrocarpa]